MEPIGEKGIDTIGAGTIEKIGITLCSTNHEVMSLYQKGMIRGWWGPRKWEWKQYLEYNTWCDLKGWCCCVELKRDPHTSS